MPIPSAIVQKYFDHAQIFLTMVKSDILPYRYANLCMVKNIWPHSKNNELSLNFLNAIKIFFELADGLGIRLFGKDMDYS